MSNIDFDKRQLILWHYLLYACLFFIISVNFSLNLSKTGQYFLDLNKFMNGETAIPYQYRILTIPLFRGLIDLFGTVDLSTSLRHWPAYLIKPYQQAYFIVNTMSYFIALGTFSCMAQKVFVSRGDVFCAVALFLFISYAVFILNPDLQFILPYDLPSLAFEQLCCLLVLKRRWVVLSAVFALATLNRETDFLIILFLVTRAWTGSEDRRTGLAVAAFLSVIWWTIKLSLLFLITGVGSDAPLGGIANFKPIYNFTTMLKPWQWPSLCLLFVPLILTIWFLFEKPSKKALDWILPYIAGFSMIFVVANITEHRSFGDLTGFAAMSLMFFFKSRDVFAFASADVVSKPKSALFNRYTRRAETPAASLLPLKPEPVSKQACSFFQRFR